MQQEIRLKYKWIKQRRKEILLFLDTNYWISKSTDSKTDILNDLGITGDDAAGLIQKFERDFIVDMGNFNFTEYFETEGGANVAPLLMVVLLLKLFLLPFAVLILPFSPSGYKEMIFYNPFTKTIPRKKGLTVGDLIISSFTHKFTLQKDVVLKLI